MGSAILGIHMSEELTREIKLNIRYRKLKRLHIKALSAEILQVDAPFGTKAADVWEVINSNITKIRAMLRHAEKNPLVLRYEDGVRIRYLGGELELCYVEGVKYTWRLAEKLFINKVYQAQSPAVLDLFYRARSQMLKQRCHELAQRFGFVVSKIRITGAERRHGSCSTAGGISFSRNLIMAPIAVIDYVICHELAHLKHHNHSKDFWLEVEKMVPDYRVKIQWLMDNSIRIPQSLD